jgi:hypothetical protein
MLLPSNGFADGRRFVQRSVQSNCGHHIQQQIVEYPHIVQEQVYYFVGQPLRIDSLLRLEQAEKERFEKNYQSKEYSEYPMFKADYDRLQQEFRQFQAWRQTQKTKEYNQSENTTAGNCPTCRNDSPVTSQQPAEQPADTTPPNTKNTNGTDNPSPDYAGSLFVEKCGKCHSGATPKGQLTLTLDTTLNLASYKAIVKAIDSGKMPKGGPPLSANEADQIKSELLQLTQ